MTFFHQITAASFKFESAPPPPGTPMVTYSAEGGSLWFENQGNYMSFAASTDWAVGTEDYTIEWWQWMEVNQDFPRVFSMGSYPSATFAVSIEGGTLYLWANGGVVTGWGIEGYQEKWTHFAIVRESGDTRLFMDGEAYSSTSALYNISATDVALTLGNESTLAGESTFLGYITNFRWTKGEAIYTINFTPPDEVLSVGANTKLLLLANDELNYTVDSTDLNNPVTWNVTWKRVGPLAQLAWQDAGDPSSYPGSGDDWTNLTVYGGDIILTNTTFGLLQGGYIDFGLTGSGQFNSNPADSTANKTPSSTITMWANIQQTSNFNFVAGLRGGTNYGFWFLMLDSDGLTEARVATDTGFYDINVDFSSYYGTWCHICFTVNNDKSQLYLNGSLVGSNNTVSGTWGTPPSEFRLASEVGGWNQSENLRMATFRYHTRARTAAEILAEFNAERARYGI